MDEINVKIAIIGAGSAGLSAAKQVSKLTDDYVLINGGSYGTTCARVGCMPSKAFIQFANDYHHNQPSSSKQERAFKSEISKLMKDVRILRDGFVQGVIESTESMGNKNIKGYASFLEPDLLQVSGKKIRTQATIIATGSYPVIPPNWMRFEPQILTTDTFFEQESFKSPFSVIGGGPIGLELGLALSKLGIKVTIFEASDFIAGLSDPEVNEYAIKSLSKELDIITGSFAEAKQGKSGLILSANGKEVPASQVLMAVGRRPNIERLQLKNLKVRLNKDGLPDFDLCTLKVDGLPIFLAGDVNKFRPLLHEAADEGRIAGFNVLQEKPHPFCRRTPLFITFTNPNIVIVGKRHAEIKDIPHLTGSITFDDQGRAKIMGQNTGMLKIYADLKTTRLLGAEMIAPEGEFLGHLLAWAIQQGQSAFDVLNMPFYHPTIVEGLRTALRNIVSQHKGEIPQFEIAPCRSQGLDCLS